MCLKFKGIQLFILLPAKKFIVVKPPILIQIYWQLKKKIMSHYESYENKIVIGFDIICNEINVSLF